MTTRDREAQIGDRDVVRLLERHRERLVLHPLVLGAAATATSARVLENERNILSIALQYKRALQDGLDRIEL